MMMVKSVALETVGNNMQKVAMIITIIAIGVLFIGNCYNYIWIGKRFFKSFLSGFTIAISARTKIFPLALIF
jgi:hypothetical protein